jgi:hypothetical protein
MHKISVSNHNAKEVCENDEEDNGLSKHGEEEGLLGLLGVGVGWDISISSIESVLLVNPNEVAEIPNAKKDY